ncbi:HK97 family phage prohead protease [Patiriisocius marinus]|uniref:HK97 family phage prohead protease n=1 Tax=Patiriisocius marinus TaxID=1397112 RepID=UPI00232FE103|nr:HK97 family phage prohead protease [Patiriisocius marinus]
MSKPDTNAVERRYVSQEVRMSNADDNNGVIEGYAAVYGARADLHYFEEEVLPGAFDEVLMDDVRCLINHDPQYVLARSVNGEGTLKLELDEKGLKYSYKTPNRSYAKDLQDAIESGDVNQSSFAFFVKEDRWQKRDGKPDLRSIVKFSQLLDVSPVTYPAYDAATVGKRSWEARQAEKNTQKTEDKIQTNGDNSVKTLALHEARHIITVNKSK